MDETWIKDMLTPRTDFTEVEAHVPSFRNTGYHFGYGYMWWLWQQTADSRFKGACSAFGNMGQSISVFPAAGVVVAYKTKEAYERETTQSAQYKVLSLAVGSFDGFYKSHNNEAPTANLFIMDDPAGDRPNR